MHGGQRRQSSMTITGSKRIDSQETGDSGQLTADCRQWTVNDESSTEDGRVCTLSAVCCQLKKAVA